MSSTASIISKDNKPGDQQSKSSSSLDDEDLKEVVLATVTDLCSQYAACHKLKELRIPAAVLLLALVATGKAHLVVMHFASSIYWVFLRIVAMTVGIGLGLGLSTHVYDQFEYWAGQSRNSSFGNNQCNPRSSASGTRKGETQAPLMDQMRGAGSRSNSSSQQIPSGKQFTKVAPATGGSSKVDLLNDSSYASLMASAGYDVDPNWKRGQIVRDYLPTAYHFCSKSVEQQYAVQVMALEWPTLPPQILKELGRFMEFVMRDYVSTWYSMIDVGIPNPEMVLMQEERKQAEAKREKWKPLPPEAQQQQLAGAQSFPRRMVFSTCSTRALPLLENMYRSMSVVFGNLAHRCQDVNVFRLMLLKWTKVIAHTFKMYRQLRKAILDKQDAHKGDKEQGLGRVVRGVINSVKSDASSIAQQVEASMSDLGTINSNAVAPLSEGNLPSVAGPTEEGGMCPHNPAYQQVSEMALTREFLVTGKLHPACTFGLEVPSLLFADPLGQDCGSGEEEGGDNSRSSSPNLKTQEQVLEARLYQTRLVAECELDYCRVLASRIIKLLTPRNDHGSPITASLLTEILGGCVLAPSMECFSPDYLNDWIIKGIEYATGVAEQEEATPTTGNANNNGSAATGVDENGRPIMRTWDDADAEVGDDNNMHGSPFPEEDSQMVLEDAFDQGGEQELTDLMDLSANEIDYCELNNEAAEDLLGTASEEDDTLHEAKPDAAGNMDDDEATDDDDIEEDDIIMEEATNAAGVYHLVSHFAEVLMNLNRQLDLEDCRNHSQGGSSVEVDWDSPACKQDVLRLVLAVEALLLHGRRRVPIPIVTFSSNDEEGDNKVDATVQDEFNSSAMTQILMDLTSDIEAFKRMHIKPEDSLDDGTHEDVSQEDGEAVESRAYEPAPSDLSTLRTLIAAWLHTGSIFNTISILVKAKTTVLRPFYYSHAFLRNPQTTAALLRQLKTLDGVDVMVDTVAILNSERIDPEFEAQAQAQASTADSGNSSDEGMGDVRTQDEAYETKSDGHQKKKFGIKGLLDKGMQNLNKKKAIGEKVNKDVLTQSLKGRTPSRVEIEPTPMQSQAIKPVAAEKPRRNPELSQSVPTSSSHTNFSQIHGVPGGTPSYLDFHRNGAFASSLRSERERRMQSWITSMQNDTEMLQVVTRIKGATTEDTALHRELHHVARIFYAGTNLIGIRDAARSGAPRNHVQLSPTDSTHSAVSSVDDQSQEVSLLTVEMACSRRRIEVPDDDSSFLLRAQPRPLNSMGVHRDTRNADASYKGFAASFEEPAVLQTSTKSKAGRYVRRCQLRYYPSDRTASVVLLNDTRKLDQRKGKGTAPDKHYGRQVSVTLGPAPFLSPAFLRERHLCQKWIPKGSTSRSQPGLMSSSMMEQADFTAAPRTGKALDFVYRMSLFESPMIDLGGKRFTVHDTPSQGHRADASALEMSDAALSAALLVCGRDYSLIGMQQPDNVSSPSNMRNKVELGPDGYPIIWMKYSRKLADGTASTEIKPYRVSFIRAAMLITSTRQEAQLQCLVKCVKAGSAKSATKARTDAQLRPTLRLVDFARDRSREKQEKLLRDLKLGINHIDREQLRRNALLSPRYPTEILNIQVSVEKAMPAKDAIVRIPGNPQSTVFKIRCVATVALVNEEVPMEALEQYRTPDGKLAVTYKESWAVFRPFRDFQTLHKHLKTQVSLAESSGTAGSRLVGAAAAAFAAGISNNANRRQRGALIPSLGQANKAGALGVTQRSITKRMEVLDRYLHQLVSNGNLLSSSPEVLSFIGAFFPLSNDVRVGKMPLSSLGDRLGRAEMAREALNFAKMAPTRNPAVKNKAKDVADFSSGQDNLEIPKSRTSNLHLDTHDPESDEKAEKVVMTNSAVVNKIEKVPLGQVRNRVFELMTHQFGFENASFFRGQMLSAIKTMSFAVTTPSEFRKMLYKVHLDQFSPDALAFWINYGIEMLWPDGVFYESAPKLTPEEQKNLAHRSRAMLHNAFPEQLRTVLGGNLTRDGLDMLHEMLQNRMVVKSMFYMLIDLVWEEVFPEMKDILPGGAALDINFDEE